MTRFPTISVKDRTQMYNDYGPGGALYNTHTGAVTSIEIAGQRGMVEPQSNANDAAVGNKAKPVLEF